MSQTEAGVLKALNREFENRRVKNPSYSLRAYARDLGVHASALSEIFSGRRGVTRRMGKQLLMQLPVAAGAGDVPTLLAGLRGRNSKKARQREIADNPVRVLERDAFLLISEWHYYAILSLAETDDFQGDDPVWIAKRLGITPRTAEQALMRLIRLGLLVRDDEKRCFKTSGAQLATTSDIPDLAIRRSHHQTLELASRALDEVDVELREFGAMTMAIDSKRLPEAKERIRAFRREMSAFLESGSRRDEVYRLSVQLFPLSKKERRR